MLTVHSLADRLALSVPQTRRLLRSVHSVVQSGVSRGRSNQIRISTDIVGVLDRSRSLWIDHGVTLDDLPDALNAELNGDSPVVHADNELSDADHLPGGWRQYVQHLEAELDRRDNEIDFLRGRVQHLEQLALPGPRRSFLDRILGR